jgi:restriction endonuclease S subunit
MALAEHIGYDATARPDSNDLPGIATHYHNGTGSLDEKIIRIRRKDVTGSKRLDPLYHYLGPVIEQAFSRLPYPTTTLSKIAGQSIQSGKSPKGGAKYSVGEIPILLVGNMNPDGSLALDDLYYVDEEFYKENKDKGAIQPLDILIAKDGATTGKVGIVPEEFDLERCLINEHIFKLTVGAALAGEQPPIGADEIRRMKILNTYYVFFFLQSWLGQQQINREVSGGAQGGITKGFVENILVPLPPVDERQRFVHRAAMEYRKYLELSVQAKTQRTKFEDSLSREMRGWNGEAPTITEEQFEDAVRRVIRRL